LPDRLPFPPFVGACNMRRGRSLRTRPWI
jgi:hypothetical protein